MNYLYTIWLVITVLCAAITAIGIISSIITKSLDDGLPLILPFGTLLVVLLLLGAPWYSCISRETRDAMSGVGLFFILIGLPGFLSVFCDLLKIKLF